MYNRVDISIVHPGPLSGCNIFEQCFFFKKGRETAHSSLVKRLSVQFSRKHWCIAAQCNWWILGVWSLCSDLNSLVTVDFEFVVRVFQISRELACYYLRFYRILCFQSARSVYVVFSNYAMAGFESWWWRFIKRAVFIRFDIGFWSVFFLFRFDYVSYCGFFSCSRVLGECFICSNFWIYMILFLKIGFCNMRK